MVNRAKSDVATGISAAQAAQKDIFTGAVVIAAIIMFVGTGTSVLTETINMITGVGGGSDRTLTITLILNIALILFGWRRYNDLAKEVDERKAAEERANTLALRDPLTGFHNRRSLSENGAAMLAKAVRRDKALAMLMLDLDHFKNVNDMHGHAVGDALLRAVAAEIAKLMPPNSLSARLGGDEFACTFMFDIANREVVDRVAEAIVTRLAQPFDADGIFTHISVSLGIAHSERDCDSIDALMRRSDIAMYAAKHQGRNRMAWFDDPKYQL